MKRFIISTSILVVYLLVMLTMAWFNLDRANKRCDEYRTMLIETQDIAKDAIDGVINERMITWAENHRQTDKTNQISTYTGWLFTLDADTIRLATASSDADTRNEITISIAGQERSFTVERFMKQLGFNDDMNAYHSAGIISVTNNPSKVNIGKTGVITRQGE